MLSSINTGYYDSQLSEYYNQKKQSTAQSGKDASTGQDENTELTALLSSFIPLSMEDIQEQMQSESGKINMSFLTQEETTSESGTSSLLSSSIDADGDGTISTDEYEALMEEMGIEDPMSAEDFFSLFDADGDGEITAAEMEASKPAGPPPVSSNDENEETYASLDTNEDGTVSAEEYASFMEEMRSENPRNRDIMSSAVESYESSYSYLPFELSESFSAAL